MELNYKKKGNAIVIYLQGNIDIYFTAFNENEINNLLSDETTSHFLLNLQDVDSISSSGLGILISTKLILKKRGMRLVLCNMNDIVRRIFRIVKYDEIFDIFNTEDDSLEFLKNI